MFPLNWNIPFIRKNGSRTTLGAITGDIAGIEEDVTELTVKAEGLWDNMMDNGAVNLLPINASTTEDNGITFTVNADGTITANGTATANANLVLYSGANLLKSGTYRLTGALNANNLIRITNPFSGDYPTDSGNGVIFTITSDMQASNLYIFIRVSSGQVLNNAVFKPMISNAALDLSYADYQPYAKSNRELTEEKLSLSDLKTVVAASSDFADFKTKVAAL